MEKVNQLVDELFNVELEMPSYEGFAQDKKLAETINSMFEIEYE